MPGWSVQAVAVRSVASRTMVGGVTWAAARACCWHRAQAGNRSGLGTPSTSWARSARVTAGRPAGQAVARAQAGQQRLTAEDFPDNAVGVGNQPAGDGYVDRAAGYRAGEMGKPHPLQVKHYVRCVGGQGVAQVRAQDRGDRRGDAHPDRAGVPGRDAAHGGLGGGKVIEDDLGPAEQFRAGSGERDPPGGAGEQRGAQFAFQALDQFAEGRLAHVQILGGPAEVQFSRHGHERLELPQLHDLILSHIGH